MTQQQCLVVTGASRGLGLATLEALVEDGYAVATCSRNVSGELREMMEKYGNEQVLWQSCTVGDEDQEEAFLHSVDDWLGERVLYGLINNAGVAVDGVLATLPTIEIERIVATNLLGSIRLARLVLRRMLTSKTSGRIVNVSSIVGSRGYTGLAAYAASKAGMDGLTRALAREVGRREITVNSVAPGFLETDMSSTLPDRQRQQIIRRTPLGRLGQVDDVVPLIRFLISKDAQFITGQTIIVDGGITS